KSPRKPAPTRPAAPATLPRKRGREKTKPSALYDDSRKNRSDDRDASQKKKDRFKHRAGKPQRGRKKGR
ncbi:MAG TPA: hypothetical protein VJL90_08990, partial [Pseudorhodoplanes sp.]|nr:hypothetical protein [Pseudorhodoplanes sp.]